MVNDRPSFATTFQPEVSHRADALRKWPGPLAQHFLTSPPFDLGWALWTIVFCLCGMSSSMMLGPSNTAAERQNSVTARSQNDSTGGPGTVESVV